MVSFSWRHHGLVGSLDRLSVRSTVGCGACLAEVARRSGPPTTVKGAPIQCSSVLGAVDENRQKLSQLVREAATGGAKIIVLPETAITGYLSQDLRQNWHVRERPLDAA